MENTKERLRGLLLLYKGGSFDIDGLVDKIEDLYQSDEKKSLEERKQAFVETVRPFVDMYGKEMCSDFCKYWYEASRRKKMRFELQKTWDIKMRLSTWSRNQKKFSIVGMLNKGKLNG